jgi:single-strand DNA-binding protein
MNKVILIGRVTKPIELKKTTSGKSVASFTLAVNKHYKHADGNYDADFINFVAFGQQAETISRYVSKGDRFGVIGKLNTRTYDKQDGSKVYVTEVKVDDFEFLESKKDKPTGDTEADGFEPYDDGDLPFN